MAQLDLVFLGPPGAGKGTQARDLAVARSIPHISTGDLFRAALKHGTPVGLEAKKFMDQGLLVPDDIVCRMVEERLADDDAQNGFILDGFPRTLPQAEALDSMLERIQRGLSAVISFTVGEEILKERLGGRLTCRGCGAQFHETLNPPAEAGRCDECREESLYVRDDDSTDAIVRRLEEYSEKTEPLVSYYRVRGILQEVDATPEIPTVRAALESCLA